MEVLRVAAPIQIIYSHQYYASIPKSASNSNILSCQTSYLQRDLRFKRSFVYAYNFHQARDFLRSRQLQALGSQVCSVYEVRSKQASDLQLVCRIAYSDIPQHDDDDASRKQPQLSLYPSIYPIVCYCLHQMMLLHMVLEQTYSSHAMRSLTSCYIHGQGFQTIGNDPSMY